MLNTDVIGIFLSPHEQNCAGLTAENRHYFIEDALLCVAKLFKILLTFRDQLVCLCFRATAATNPIVRINTTGRWANLFECCQKLRKCASTLW